MISVKNKIVKAFTVLVPSLLMVSCSTEIASRKVVDNFKKQVSNQEVKMNEAELSCPLTGRDAEKTAHLYQKYLDEQDKLNLRSQWENKLYYTGTYNMPIKVKYFGDHKNHRSLIISLHGGGSTTKEANDQQWENQIRLYNNINDAIYIAPRAAVDAWNMWHQEHVDVILNNIIRSYILFEGVDPDKVYITGYSAGGDGVYQLAPRLSDRLAAANMNAGHPNEVTPLGVRNVPFALFMGANDAAYKRNDIARQWKVSLDSLHKLDPDGYTHFVEVVPNKGHWMDHKDSLAIAWMSKYQRNTNPNRVVWTQDDVKHASSYWLATEIEKSKAGDFADVIKDGNEFTVKECTFSSLYIQYSPSTIDPKKPIVVSFNGTKTEYKPVFTLENMMRSADLSHDISLTYMGRIKVK